MSDQMERPAAETHRIARLIRLPEVQRRVGLGRSTIYRWMSEGTFPKPVPLGGRAVAWVERDVDEWIKLRVSAIK